MLDVSSHTGQISRRRTMENLDPIRPGVSTAAGDLEDAAYPRTWPLLRNQFNPIPPRIQNMTPRRSRYFKIVADINASRP